METIQPVLKRGRDVWDSVNMPKDEFQKRLKKIRTKMKEEDIDILLVYGHGQNDYGNPCYITNYLLKTLRGAMVIVPKKGDLTLFIRIAERDLKAARQTTWVKDLRSCGDVAKECVSYLEENNLIPSTFGSVGLKQFMPYYQLEYLRKALKQSKIVEADHIVRDMRMIKSENECDQMRRASRIVKHVFRSINEIDPKGRNEIVLEALIDRMARLEGAEDVRILIAKPKEPEWAFRPPDIMKILQGDIIIIYLAVEHERYWGEGIRTFEVEVSSIKEVKLEALLAPYKRVLEHLKTEKRISEIYKETVAQLKDDGIDYIEDYGFGQGIGISLNESPKISREDKSYLKGGMFLKLRVGMRHQTIGAGMIGDTVYITRGGVEILTE